MLRPNVRKFVMHVKTIRMFVFNRGRMQNDSFIDSFSKWFNSICLFGDDNAFCDYIHSEQINVFSVLCRIYTCLYSASKHLVQPFFLYRDQNLPLWYPNTQLNTVLYYYYVRRENSIIFSQYLCSFRQIFIESSACGSLYYHAIDHFHFASWNSIHTN